MLLGSKDEEVFLGLSLGPIREPAPAITLIPLLLLCTGNEDEEHVGTAGCEGSLLLLVFVDKEVIRLRSLVLLGICLLSLVVAT